MPPGLPAWRHLAFQDDKYAYRLEYEESWRYEMHTGPIAMSVIGICYALSKLTNQSNKLFYCFQSSHIL